MGVDLFFVLSGFLITGVLLDQKDRHIKDYFGHFYQRRALRILPPFLLLLLVTTVLFGFAWAHAWYLYPGFPNIITAFGIRQPLSLNALWSLGVEEQFYFVWPFVVYFLSEQAIAWVAGAVMLTAPLLRWFGTPLFANHWAIYSLTPFRMDTLAAGAVLAIVWRRRPQSIRRFGHFGLILSSLALGALAILARNPHFVTNANTRESNLWIYEMSLFFSAGAMLWALGGKGIGILTLAPVRYLGRISYTAYLIHLTMYCVALRYLHGKAAVALAVIVFTLAYASISWFFLERPLLSAKAKRREIPRSFDEQNSDRHSIVA